MKNYDNLFLMHYGVKGMKWRYHKNNGSTSLYAKRRSQMRYSASASGKPDGDAESTRKNPTPNPRYSIDSNGNPENTRKRLIEEQIQRSQSRAYADKIKAVTERNIKNIGGKERKAQPIDSILPKESKMEAAFRKPGRDLKKKMSEYDNTGSNGNPENTRKKREKEAQKQIDKQFDKAKSDAAAARIKSASDKAVRNIGSREKQPIDVMNKPKKGLNKAFEEPSRKLKKKRSEYGKNIKLR